MCRKVPDTVRSSFVQGSLRVLQLSLTLLVQAGAQIWCAKKGVGVKDVCTVV